MHRWGSLIVRSASSLRTPSRVRSTVLRTYSTNDNAAIKVSEKTMRRFWKTATVHEMEGKLTVALDGRPIKTPDGQKILLTSGQRPLAGLLAAEWDSQARVLKTHSLPLTSLVARAIDGFSKENGEEKKEAIERLMKYLDTDAVCFHEEFPESLVKLQTQYWDPIIAWARKEFNVTIRKQEGILATGQPEETHQAMRSIVESLSPLELAAFERATMVTKSFLTALALVKRAISLEHAAQAAHVEVNWQIERWGEVEDTHDVDREEVRRQLGSCVCALL
ncbi:uncharacterized protein VTP21DRAFT_7006 [Calcarisporiella thermophila]|uniref:uncharacterized protein n=1 Tax=Calcarisporiella thermophila TaxID=911321 RepID=UPI0037448D37